MNEMKWNEKNDTTKMDINTVFSAEKMPRCNGNHHHHCPNNKHKNKTKNKNHKKSIGRKYGQQKKRERETVLEIGH